MPSFHGGPVTVRDLYCGHMPPSCKAVFAYARYDGDMDTENNRYIIEQAQASDVSRYDNDIQSWEAQCAGDTPEQVLAHLLSLLNGDEIVVTDSWLRLKIVRKDGSVEVRNY